MLDLYPHRNSPPPVLCSSLSFAFDVPLFLKESQSDYCKLRTNGEFVRSQKLVVAAPTFGWIIFQACFGAPPLLFWVIIGIVVLLTFKTFDVRQYFWSLHAFGTFISNVVIRDSRPWIISSEFLDLVWRSQYQRDAMESSCNSRRWSAVWRFDKGGERFVIAEHFTYWFMKRQLPHDLFLFRAFSFWLQCTCTVSFA